MRQIISSLPGTRLLRRIKHRLDHAQASHGYQLIRASEITPEMADGWKKETIPARQRQIADAELAQMRAGYVPRVFEVAAEAVRQTGCDHPAILEIGCASGFYSEALDYLLGQKIRYAGLDYSMPLVRLARETYPELPFLNADATRLPFADATWDVIISGCVILHIPDWQTAAIETVRVAKEWCIFHRTPICSGPTTLVSKLAYDVKVLEWLFNETEWVDTIRRCGCELTAAFPIATGAAIKGIADDLSSITYLFRKTAD
jgi:SAM-dependent methyltransferase